MANFTRDPILKFLLFYPVARTELTTLEPVIINSPVNPMLKEFNKLQNSRRHRQKTGKIALEGPNLVKEALKAELYPEVVFFSDTYFELEGREITAKLPAGCRIFLMPPELFKKITATEAPQPVAAIFQFERQEYLRRFEDLPGLAVVLDRLQDPGNMGTIIRTAAAAGVEVLYYTAGSTDPYGPKVLRSTAGAVFHLRLEQVPDALQLLDDLKKSGLQVAAAAARPGRLYWQVDFKPPTALIIGNEAGGITEELLLKADLQVSIPLHGRVESLNAAVASAVLMYEVVRQRSS